MPRLGRRTRLPERPREILWSVFSKVAAALDEHGLLTEPRLFGRLERQLAKMARPPFEFCVVDEAQDIGVAELRFLATLGAGRPDALFFAGDLGQRIFQTHDRKTSKHRSQADNINEHTAHGERNHKNDIALTLDRQPATTSMP